MKKLLFFIFLASSLQAQTNNLEVKQVLRITGAGTTLSAPGTVSLRNNAGVLECSQNGAAYTSCAGSGSVGWTRSAPTISTAVATDRVMVGFTTPGDFVTSPTFDGALVAKNFLYATNGVNTNASVLGMGWDSVTASMQIASGHTGSAPDLPITFKASGHEVIRIDPAGHLLVGLTSSDNNCGVTTCTLVHGQVASVSATTDASIVSMFANTSAGLTQIASGKTGAGSYLPIAFYVNGSQVIQMQTTGALELVQSYAGGTLSDAGTVALRNNAGSFEVSQNGGAWTAIGGGSVTGSGTAGRIPKFTAGTTLANSSISETADPFIQLNTSYTGGNLSSAGTVALRNNAGVLEKSENGGAWAGFAGGGGSVSSSTMTNHGLVYATGAAAIASTVAATNGQLLIGSTGANPVAAALTAGSNIAITNGAGSITVGLTGTVPIANGGTNTTTFTSNSIPYFDGTKLNNTGITWDSGNSRPLFGITSSDVASGSGSIVAAGAIQTVTAAVNASIGSYAVVPGSFVAFASGRTGSGTFLPMAFFTGVGLSGDIMDLELDNTNSATDTAMLLYFNGSLRRVTTHLCGVNTCLGF